LVNGPALAHAAPNERVALAIRTMGLPDLLMLSDDPATDSVVDPNYAAHPGEIDLKPDDGRTIAYRNTGKVVYTSYGFRHRWEWLLWVRSSGGTAP